MYRSVFYFVSRICVVKFDDVFFLNKIYLISFFRVIFKVIFRYYIGDKFSLILRIFIEYFLGGCICLEL